MNTAADKNATEHAVTERLPRIVGLRLTNDHEIRERLQVLMGLEQDLPPTRKPVLTSNVHRIATLLQAHG